MFTFDIHFASSIYEQVSLYPYDLIRRWNKLWKLHMNQTWTEFELSTLVVISTDCKDSCKSNHHTSTTTMAPKINQYKGCRCLIFILILRWFRYIWIITWFVARLTRQVPQLEQKLLNLPGFVVFNL